MNCIYCGNKCTEASRKVSIDNNTFYTCCDECEKRFNKYYNDMNKNKNKFLLLLIISCIISIFGCFLSGAWGLVLPFISFGLTITIYPYTTFGFIELAGIRKSINIARTFGVILIIIGILIYTF
ncbi:hypothetical protein [Clostridium sardiniense]|uniref:hypothetical protein n=1 Tax=Clostridium sardiniense TaxID=29369 RepID=UPI003D332845